MSLINDALRRASQSEKDRPRRVSTPMGMELAPVARSSRLSVVLIAIVLGALLLAGWFFWQWWNARNNSSGVVTTANIAPPVTPKVVAPPVILPKPAPVAPAAPAPVVLAVPPAFEAPVAPPSAVNETQNTWPVDLKLSAIFFSKTKPRVLIGGALYGTGDKIEGVVLEKIEKDRVTLEWNGHTKVLMMEGQ